MTISNTAPILEMLAAELERPRELSAQVVKYISGTYDIDRDAIGPFLTDELPKLEDDDIDLILSPLFTPKLKDQAIFAELLGRDSIPSLQWPDLIQQLKERPTRAQLITSDGQVHAVPLREVTLERHIHRLRLEGSIPEGLFALIGTTVPAPDRPLAKAIARRAVWEDAARRGILERYLSNAARMEMYRLDDAVELLNRVESYRPADTADLQARIPRWQKVLQEEIQSGGGRPFFSPTIRDTHGGERDQRSQDEMRLSAKELELAFLQRLERVLKG